MIKELKKEEMIEYVNKAYLEFHKKVTSVVEMEEMWSFYHNKGHEIWLWWAIEHESGEGNSFLVWDEGA